MLAAVKIMAIDAVVGVDDSKAGWFYFRQDRQTSVTESPAILRAGQDLATAVQVVC